MTNTNQAVPRDRVAVVGIGRMGANMARRLAEKDFHLTAIYDRKHEIAAHLATELNCHAANDLSEVTAEADFIVTVVSDDAAMREIFLGEGENLLLNARGKTFLNCATVSPAVHREVEAAAKKAGAAAIEVCMASSIPQARAGTLFLIVGGDPAAVEAAAPVLDALGADRRYAGETGRAAQVKALVNMVMNINTAGLAEGLGVGAALGLDVGLLREVFARTGADSRVLATDGGDMQNRDHECYFSAAHAAKDSGIAAALAREAGVAAPLAEAALGQYRRMVEAGLGELDKSGVAELTFPGRGRPAA